MNIEQARRTQIFTPLHIVRDMIRIVPDISGTILDLCAGEGVFTSVLIEEFKVDPSRITLIEIDPILCDKLRKKFPLCNVIEGDLFESTKGCAGKFDVIFSNPPYQIRDGGYQASASPIYHKIVMYTIDNLQPRYISMITPSRWMSGGKGLNKYRAHMLADTRIRLIQDFPGNSEIFKTVNIMGGVSYFLWDKDYSGECEFNGIRRYLDRFDIVIRDNTVLPILKKVLDKHPAGQFCVQKVLPRKPFGLPTNFKDWVPNNTEGAVKCYSINQKQNYVLKDAFTDNRNVFKKWKVVTSNARNCSVSNGSAPVISVMFLVEPNSICTETYVVVDSFGTKKEALNYLNYMRSKLYRYLLLLRTPTQHVTRDKFAWVPDLQDYTRAYTDQDLYKHFGLTRKEIEHIESTIKELK